MPSPSPLLSPATSPSPSHSSPPPWTPSMPTFPRSSPILPKYLFDLKKSESCHLTLHPPLPPPPFTANRRRSAVQSARVLPQIIKPLSVEGKINAALHHLRVVDPLLATLIDTHQPPAFESHHSPFLALTQSILYQQLAYKAGTSIYNRFVALCGGETVKNADGLLCFLLLCLGCFPDHLSFLRIHQPPNSLLDFSCFHEPTFRTFIHW
ncbi:unnamed protein product [Coffea canephora]|uniref:Uncharacterized protein n=1 Tax=Coffea canephora TaxID=49390 RepID=A0A068UCX3_COFCA|nr:unnamed protein product [Coffea canephora]